MTSVLVPAIIRQLPDHVANQIAAGEVVERPAAVVKELVENSLDAGATRITVRIEDGGRRLVEVEDDGSGMRREDLRLAVARHATSKLSNAEDLFRIATLGFRGEALPSIAAVSEFTLASRPHDADQGWSLSLVGGKENMFEPCAMAIGTRTSVRNLFWNVPARLKFLKSEASETGHVTDQVMRLALSHPAVAFRLEHAGRTLIDLPPRETLDARIRTLFGKDLATRLLPVAHATDTMQISGFVGHPQEARPTSKRQFLFLNGRFVRDRLLLAAVREGYKGFLEPRLHGTVFLHLDIDPASVDVNVHPTKSEVRFRAEGEVFTLVRTGIQHALAGNQDGFQLLVPDHGLTKQTIKAPASSLPVAPAPQPMIVTQERFLPQNNDMAEDRRTAAQSPSIFAPTGVGSQRVAESAAYTVQTSAPASSQRTNVVPADAGITSATSDATSIPGLRRIVQLNRMFLLIETDQGIRLVDQHALHEKSLFLRLDPRAGDLNRAGRQELLVPIRVELMASDVAAIASLLPELARFSIEAEVFGPTTVLVRAFPVVLKRLNWVSFFGDLAESGSTAKASQSLEERIIHRAACHGAIKAGHILSPDEQLELAQLLYRMEGMEHCPHGRPTTLDLTWKELERRFQR